MIFCTVGTTDFDPLVQAMDALAPALGEPVIFQIGGGRYEPRHGEWFRLRPAIDDLLAQARLVVAHGGFGTIVEVLSLGRPLVCAPNPDRYDHHQEEILRRFAAEGYLLTCYDLADLAAAIAQAGQTTFRAYQPPETSLHLEIRDFLAQRRR